MALNPRFRSLLMRAIREFAESGYTSEADLQQWLVRLHAALEVELPTDEQTRKALLDILGTIYRKDVDRLGVVKRVPGISRYTLDRIAPELRAELDRRIFAGADLIRLNRTAAVQKTLQRFSGWVTSVPKDGASETDLRSVVEHIAKPAKQVKYEARRVAIDQGHKLSAAVAHVAAKGEGAIAAIWHDRGERDHSYDARLSHLARSGNLFLIRDSWAIDQGLVKRGSAQYTDEIEQPAEFVFCSCYYEYITSPARLPREVLTTKGHEWVASSEGRPPLRAVTA